MSIAQKLIVWSVIYLNTHVCNWTLGLNLLIVLSSGFAYQAISRIGRPIFYLFLFTFFFNIQKKNLDNIIVIIFKKFRKKT